MGSKARPDLQAVLPVGEADHAVLCQNLAALQLLHAEMLPFCMIGAKHGGLDPEGRSLHPVQVKIHTDAVRFLIYLHLDGKIRPQLLFPLRVIHLPPVAGSLRLLKRQIIPAVHHLRKPEAVLRLLQFLRLEGAMLADAAADLQRHVDGRIAEIQEIALPLHQRISEISLPGPDDPRFPVQLPEVLRLISRAALIIDQIRMGHVFHQAVRRLQMIFLR